MDIENVITSEQTFSAFVIPADRVIDEMSRWNLGKHVGFQVTSFLFLSCADWKATGTGSPDTGVLPRGQSLKPTVLSQSRTPPGGGHFLDQSKEEGRRAEAACPGLVRARDEKEVPEGPTSHRAVSSQCPRALGPHSSETSDVGSGYWMVSANRGPADNLSSDPPTKTTFFWGGGRHCSRHFL